MNTIEPVIIQPTIKERIAAMLEIVLKKSKLNPLFLPTIRNLATGYLNDMDEAELRKGIIELRETFIPWLLGEVVQDDNPPPQ